MSTGPFPQVGITTSEVERFRQLIAKRLGLAFDDSKLEFLGEVLHRRVEVERLPVDAYLSHVEGHLSADESGALAQELTVPETYFFRNSDQFHALTAHVIPSRVRAQQARRSLRVLSAGCASGEEAYSLAMVLREHVPDPMWDVSIRGVDLNPTVIERAQRGRYGAWSLRETPKTQLKWFRPEGRDVVLDDVVRQAVRFEQRNLAQDDAELWHAETYDIIFCRNVVMYFTPEHSRALITRIARSLAPGGYLFLGHAETLRGLSHDFHLRHTHGTFYYQRKEHTDRTRFEEVVEPTLDLRELALPSAIETSTSWVEAIQVATGKIEALAGAPAPRQVGSRSTSLQAPRPPLKPDLRLAFELLGRERFTDALGVLRGLPPESAGDPDVLILEAALLTHSGKLADAKLVCERLLVIDELSAGAHYVLALCREAEGDRRGATDHDQVAVYLDPTFAMPRLHLGLLARRAGDFSMARRELGQAMLLLQRDDAPRLLLFGGGFSRDALVTLCAAELSACGDRQ